MLNRFHSVDFVSIGATSSTVYSRLFDFVKFDFVKPQRKNVLTGQIEFIKPPIFQTHVENGLSDKAKRNLKKSVETLLNMTDENIMLNGQGKNKIGFMTLTLPASQIKEYKRMDIIYKHTDKEIKSLCFNQFMTEIRKAYIDINFVWVCEKQLNGNIHFHLLIDKFIPYIDIRNIWNRCVNKLGYVDEYQSKMKQFNLKSYINEFAKKDKNNNIDKKEVKRLINSYRNGYLSDWKNPNSVSIENLRKVENVAAYIVKYMSKGHIQSEKFEKYSKELFLKYGTLPFAVEKLQLIDGRLWGCSQSVSKKRKCVLLLEGSQILKDSFKSLTDKVKEKRVFYEERFITCLHTFKSLKIEASPLFYHYINHLKNEITDTFNHSVDAFLSTVNQFVYNPLLSNLEVKEAVQQVLFEVPKVQKIRHYE